MASVEDSWREATVGLDEAARDAWLTRLLDSYSKERGTYYNLDCLREKLLHYQEIKESLKNSQAVLLALLFMNFEYDPKTLDEENKDLDHFTAFATEAGIPDDSELLTETQALLRAASTHSTDAHKVGGAYGSEDAHYLLDLDIAVLGSDPEKYAEYKDKVREDYPFLSEPMYTALRLKVLQNFLEIPNIFATKEFRERFEEQARANIQSEIELLST